MAIEIESNGISWQKKLAASGSSKEERRKPGHPLFLSDQELQLRRNSIYSVVADGWARIGWRLQTAQTIQNVSNAIRGLGLIHDGMGHHGIATFVQLGPLRANAMSSDLRQLRRHSASLGEQSRELYRERTEAEESLRTLERAMQQADAKTRRRFRSDFESERRQLQKLRRKENDVAEKWRSTAREADALAAQLACEELLRFVRERRYAFTPINFANAMAGLPEVSYRQSVLRCVRLSNAPVEPLNYELFKTLRRLLRRCMDEKPNQLLRCLRREILRLPKRDDARKHLGDHWYCLKQALEKPGKGTYDGERLFTVTDAYLSCCYEGRTAITEALLQRNRIKQ